MEKFCTDKCGALLLARLAGDYGITDAVLCPGSRNAPVNVALAARLRTHTAVDERSGAFMALGIALSTGRPVIFACTSGSALLDAAPAVAEAYYRHVPLVIVSADRPGEWIDQDDSQTIRQPQALAAITRMTVDLPDNSGKAQYINRLINQAFSAATDSPVHINIQLNVPLGLEGKPGDDNASRLIRSYHTVPTAASLCADLSVGPLIRELAAHPDHTLLYITGLNAAFTDIEAMERSLRVIADSGVTVVAEFQSGLRGDFIIPAGNWNPQSMPEVLVTFGGAPVIDRIKRFFRHNPPRRHIRIAVDNDTVIDTYRCLTDRVAVDPLPFVEAWSASAEFSSSLSPVRSFEITEPSGKEQLLVGALIEMAGGMDIHLSNGMTVRHAQHFPVPAGARVFCNRGVSGIDGSTSTAIGCAAVSHRSTLLITGDMSFRYDIAALSLPGIPTGFRIAVIDNRGGDIFRHVPSTSSRACREEMFCCPGGYFPELGKIADLWHFDYREAVNTDEIYSWMSTSIDKPSILRVINHKQVAIGANNL